MARRRRSTRVSSGAIAVVGGALLLFAAAARAGAGNPYTKINVNIYIGGSCDTNPTNADPTDTHVFYYNIGWKYMATTPDGTIVDAKSGRVGRVTAMQSPQGTDVDLTQALDPIPSYIRISNPLGLAPNDWTTATCVFPYGLCKPSNPSDGCCIPFTNIKTGEATILNHSLIYEVLEDPCIDCHYESCQPDGHSVPKGGGICAPFKYIRSGDQCSQIPSEYCDQYGPRDQGCWYQGPFGPYRGKCYIRIQ